MDSTIGYQAKRFVIEDSITKVSSDGEPHGVITIIAGCSGVIAAIIILAILASITECRLARRSTSAGNEQQQQQCGNDAQTRLACKKQMAIIVAANQSAQKTTDAEERRESVISKGNLNLAFVNEDTNSELKSTKRAHFSDNIDNIPLGEFYKATETRIEIERF